MNPTRPRFIAITGPTASGKTDLSLALADEIEVEIVSMDSRQVYRGMDIGTDKVRSEDRDRVPHHGLDLVDPDQRYSAGHFARDARAWIAEIEGRGRIPVLVGGTGFFLRALMAPIFAEPPLDEVRLARLRQYLGRQDPSLLSRWVGHLDPRRAELAREGGPQRMIRTIEVALLTGYPLSWWHEVAPTEDQAVPGVVIRLQVERTEMDRRIDERVARMVERGLMDEVGALLAAGYTDSDPGMTGTGYREMLAYLRGDTSLEEAMEEIRRNTRRYSRRQITWFRHQLPEDSLRVDVASPLEVQVRVILDAWRAAVQPARFEERAGS